MSKEPKDPFENEVAVFEVGGEKLEVRPLPLNKLKDALVIFRTALSLAQTAAQGDPMAILNQVPELAVENFAKLAPIILQKPSMNQEWIGDNISLPLARRILEECVRVNGMADFFPIARKAERAPAEAPTTDTPSSTTSSPSTTDGPSKK